MLKDLTGQKFGRFTVLNRANRTDIARIAYWECLCECGNKKTVRGSNLRDGGTKSCGCLNKEGVNRHNLPNNLTRIDGTCIELLKSKKIYSNNKTGHRGVCLDNTNNIYKAYIGFKRKVYRLGSYNNLSDAITARKNAEENIYGEFLQWYEEHIKLNIENKV